MSPFHSAIYLVILLIFALPFVVLGTFTVWAVRRYRSAKHRPAPDKLK
jgi:hypothetical protein